MACEITNLLGMRDYIKRQLGYPVICVEIANEQLDDIICDAIKDMHRYLIGEASYKTYMAFQLSAGVSAYSISADLEAVVDFDSIQGFNGVNQLFTVEHNILYNDLVGGRLLGTGPDASTGGVLGNWNTQMMYLEEVRNEFSTLYNVQYSPLSKTLIVTPTPKEDLAGLLEVFKREDSTLLFNHILFRRLVVARAKKLWGLHLKKYALTLPGGGTINGSEIYSDGVTDEEKAFEDIKKEAAPAMFFVG